MVSPSNVSTLASRIEAVRRFSRFYTRRIGVLQETLLHSPFTLPEGRLVYEIANRDGPTAQALCGDLDLDPGYVSRMLKSLEKRGCIVREPSTTDKRATRLALTAKGRKLWEAMNQQSRDDLAGLLAGLSVARQRKLVEALETAGRLLGAPEEKRAAYVLRPHLPGDMGWIIRRQTQLYAQEHDWDGSFEAMLADIAGKFVANYDPLRERCWIAERHGEDRCFSSRPARPAASSVCSMSSPRRAVWASAPGWSGSASKMPKPRATRV